MSPEIWAGLLGVSGVLAGVFAERWFQRRGKIRCTFGELFVRAYNNSATLHEGGLPVDPQAVEGLPVWVFAGYEFNAKLFNEKDARTGLRDVTVQFVSAEGSVILENAPEISEAPSKGVPMVVPQTEIRFNDLAKPGATEIINLPSREWVNLTISGRVTGEEAQTLSDCRQARLRGYYPSGRAFVEDVPNEGTATTGPQMSLALALLLVLWDALRSDLLRNRKQRRKG